MERGQRRHRFDFARRRIGRRAEGRRRTNTTSPAIPGPSHPNTSCSATSSPHSVHPVQRGPPRLTWCAVSLPGAPLVSLSKLCSVKWWDPRSLFPNNLFIQVEAGAAMRGRRFLMEV